MEFYATISFSPASLFCSYCGEYTILIKQVKTVSKSLQFLTSNYSGDWTQVEPFFLLTLFLHLTQKS